MEEEIYVAPTCEQLFDEEDGFTSVHRNNDTSWRHGCYVTEVFHREDDNTYWQAKYRLSGDGETNELREGYATIVRVLPETYTAIRYKEIK